MHSVSIILIGFKRIGNREYYKYILLDLYFSGNTVNNQIKM